MTAEVAHREQRALWRVARHRLETRRIEFLANDEGKWQTELLANPFVLEVDENVFEDAEKVRVSVLQVAGYCWKHGSEYA